MKTSRIPLIAAATLAAALAFGATAPTPPTPAQIAANQVAHLTRLLSLESGQQATATTLFTTAATTIAGLHTSLQTAQTSLKTAIENDDATALQTLTSQIGTLVGEEALARATAEAGLYAVLSSSQKATYDELLTAPGHGGPGGPAGPGGFGGPGGGGPWNH